MRILLCAGHAVLQLRMVLRFLLVNFLQVHVLGDSSTAVSCIIYNLSCCCFLEVQLSWG
jgi:hypothetical protein